MNSPSPLDVALGHYQTALDGLETTKIRIKEEQSLDILRVRDALQKQIEADAEISIDMWSKLIAQDARLKQQSYKITQVIDLAEYRETLLCNS